MRFHLVDRVLEWEPAKSVRARKLTSLGEEFWEDEGDDLVMPPPLVLESFCQAGTWLVMITTDTRKRAALLSIGSVEFLADVRPGDVIELEGSVESMNDEVGRALRPCHRRRPRRDGGQGHHVRADRRRDAGAAGRHAAPAGDARPEREA